MAGEPAPGGQRGLGVKHNGWRKRREGFDIEIVMKVRDKLAGTGQG